MKTLIIAVLLFASPAFAQFKPPGDRRGPSLQPVRDEPGTIKQPRLRASERGKAQGQSSPRPTEPIAPLEWGGILGTPKPRDSWNPGPKARPAVRRSNVPVEEEQPNSEPEPAVEKGGWAEEKANGKAPVKGRAPEPSVAKKPTPDKSAREQEIIRIRMERAYDRRNRAVPVSTHDDYQQAAQQWIRRIQGW